MIKIDCCKESMNLLRIRDWIKNKIQFYRDHPDYFDPDGLVCFCGPQGSGKTLSAVNYVYNLLDTYPECILVTNLMLKDYPIVTYREWLESVNIQDYIPQDVELTREQENEFLSSAYRRENRVFEFRNNDDFARYSNGEKGVIFLVDEIQLYLNSLQSKNINLDVITQISQQRKQRKHIVCTSQVFGRMAKPLREQFSCVIFCKNYFRFLQINALIDRDSLDDENDTGTELHGTVKKKFFWIHNPKFYSRYDTYYVIENNQFVSGEEQIDIYNNIVDFGGKEKKNGILSRN